MKTTITSPKYCVEVEIISVKKVAHYVYNDVCKAISYEDHNALVMKLLPQLPKTTCAQDFEDFYKRSGLRVLVELEDEEAMEVFYYDRNGRHPNVNLMDSDFKEQIRQPGCIYPQEYPDIIIHVKKESYKEEREAVNKMKKTITINDVEHVKAYFKEYEHYDIQLDYIDFAHYKDDHMVNKLLRMIPKGIRYQALDDFYQKTGLRIRIRYEQEDHCVQIYDRKGNHGVEGATCVSAKLEKLIRAEEELEPCDILIDYHQETSDTKAPFYLKHILPVFSKRSDVNEAWIADFQGKPIVSSSAFKETFTIYEQHIIQYVLKLLRRREQRQALEYVQMFTVIYGNKDKEEIRYNIICVDDGSYISFELLKEAWDLEKI